MNTTWQLDSLYSSFEDVALLSDLGKIETLSEKYEELIQKQFSHYETPVQTVETFLNYIMTDLALIRKVGAFGHLSTSVDSKNQAGLNLSNKVGKFSSQLTRPMTAFKTWLKDFESLESLWGHSTLIDAHKHYLTHMKKQTQYMLSEGEEVVISKLRLTGSTAWETLQRKVSSELTGTVTLDGEEKTLPIMSIRNLAFSGDPSVRKMGYEAELKAYQTHADISAAALNGIKGEVLTLSQLRGFESPLEETLNNSKMSREILDSMIEAMEENLYLLRDYVTSKAKYLGHTSAMPFYDLFAPVAKKDKDFTIDEAKAFILEHFNAFNPDLSAFAKHAFENRWVDFEPKAGKTGGAFCSNIVPIGESRVLLNFTGKLKNVLTLAHELGHAYHGNCLKGQSILNTSYPMPLAETASIFCETIVRNAALKDADDDLRISILDNSLTNASQVVMDILSRYYFESEIFEVRNDHPLSKEEYCDIMLKSQKRAYGDALSQDTMHPYMWLNKPHYYYASRNFYNFPYAFGMLFARGLYALYLKEGDAFLPKYDALLAITGSQDIYSVCQSVGIDPTSKAFWQGSFDQIKNEVAAFKASLK